MKILSFDTSNVFTSVAISDDQVILAYLEDLRPNVQAERLLPMIEEALAFAKLSYNDIDYLGVINGPGSFTGIRTGLAAAMGILLGTKIKPIVVSNFEILYFRALAQIKHYDKIVILLNAYRGQLYTQSFYKDKSLAEPSIMDTREAIDLLIKEDSGIIACAGSGIELIYDQIKSIPNLTILPRFTRVKAVNICRYIQTIIPILSPHSVEPLYIRLPDAKIANPASTILLN